MSLHEYWAIFWRQKWLIGSTMAIALAVAAIGIQLIPPVYEATALLRITTPARGSLGDVQYDLDYADRLMNTYTTVASSRPIRTELMEQFGLDDLPELSVAILANTELLELTASAHDAKIASDLANALSVRLMAWNTESLNAETQSRQQALQQQLADAERDFSAAQTEYEALQAQANPDSGLLAALEQELDRNRDNYRLLLNQYEVLRMRPVVQTNVLTVVDPAIEPTQPAFPNIPLLLGLAMVLGLAGGLGIAFISEKLDNRLYSVQQIEETTQLPTLALVNDAKQVRWPQVIMNSHSRQEDAFGRLAADLANRAAGRGGFIVLVTSAEPGEGKSTVVANLAAALAKLGHGTIAVDCNFYHPSLHTIFQTENSVGLIDLLRRYTRLDQSTQRTQMARLHVVPTGEHLGHPAELFTLAHVTEFAKQARASGKIILLDVPALLTSFEAALLATIADGILFVVGQSIAHETAVKRAQNALVQMSEKLLGVVVTRATTSHSYFRHDYSAPSKQKTQVIQ